MDDKHESKLGDVSGTDSVVPFGIRFEVPYDEPIGMGTNTRSTSDDDTGSYRRDTDDRDT